MISDDGSADMVVKNGAEVFARTTHGIGVLKRISIIGGIQGAIFLDESGAGIIVDGSLRVENSIVDSENTC